MEGEGVSWEGSMETSRLIAQIESLRGAVRFLRSENSTLKAKDFLLELEELPSYTSPRTYQNTAKLVGVKKLMGEVREVLASPIMIDLSGKRKPESQLSLINSRTSALAMRLQLLSL